MGFSSHAPVPFDNTWSMPAEDMSAYLADMDAVRQRYLGEIEIYKGLEIDFLEAFPGHISYWTERAGLDFSIGSVHFVRSFEDGKPWEIDGTQEIFKKGLVEIFGGNEEKAVSDYFDLTMQMLEKDKPTILGHVDKIKMHNSKFPFFSEEDGWYRQKLRETLQVAKETGVIVEVNTRGIYKKRTLEPYPGKYGLQLLREMKIPICLNSDAHQPSEVSREFGSTAELLLDIGIGELATLRNGEWQLQGFDRNGLIPG